MGSVHIKANKGWKEGCKGIVKKASLRSRTGEESGREEHMG
jgi:hypothetical protein